MRRKDREITDRNEIYDVLRRCDTLRIAIHDDEYPYTVPVSFGTEIINDRIVVYFHSALEGKKIELIKKNPHVCIEGDIFHRTQETAHGITVHYESVIGFGECRFVEEQEEIVHGLELVMKHYGYLERSVEQCGSTAHVAVGKIVLNEVSGKRNLPSV